MGLVAFGVISTVMEGCSSAIPVVSASVIDNVIHVKLDLMAEKNTLIVRSKKIAADILLVRRGDEFFALEMTCTHQAQPLTATSTGLYCPTHGSTFDLEGNVTRAPALRSLKKYKVDRLNDLEVAIYLI